MQSADTLIGSTEMSPTEAGFVHERLMLCTMQAPRDVTIEEFAQNFRLMPMLVARILSDIRPEDHSLRSLIKTNEFLILTFGKSRLSRSAVEGGFMKTDKLWRNNDPLGVYQPGVDAGKTISNNAPLHGSDVHGKSYALNNQPTVQLTAVVFMSVDCPISKGRPDGSKTRTTNENIAGTVKCQRVWGVRSAVEWTAAPSTEIR